MTEKVTKFGIHVILRHPTAAMTFSPQGQRLENGRVVLSRSRLFQHRTMDKIDHKKRIKFHIGNFTTINSTN